MLLRGDILNMSESGRSKKSRVLHWLGEMRDLVSLPAVLHAYRTCVPVHLFVWG
jgi:hypothetical protein